MPGMTDALSADAGSSEERTTAAPLPLAGEPAPEATPEAVPDDAAPATEEGVDEPAVEVEADEDAEGIEGEGAEEEPVAYSPDLELFAEAVRLGVSRDEAVEFGSDNALRAHVRLSQRSQQQATEGASAARETASFADIEAPEVTPYQLPEDIAEMNGPELAGVFSGMQDHYEKAFSGLKDWQKGAQSNMVALRNAMGDLASLLQEEKFDNAVNGLGGEWGDMLGKGSVDDVSETQKANRVKLFAARDAHAQAAAAKGEFPSEAKLLQRSLAQVFTDQIKKNTLKQAAKKSRARKKMRPPAGTPGRPGFVTGEEAGIKRIADKQREMGIDAGEGPSQATGGLIRALAAE